MNKKKLMTFGIMGMFALMLVSAGLVVYYGQVQRDVNVNSPIVFVGDNSSEVDASAGESVMSADLSVESQTSVLVPLSIVTTPDEEGFTHTVNYLLDNSAGTCANYPAEGWRDECEKRIDFEGMALSEFISISMDVNVLGGYVAHIDVILDNGESLTFEYATFDSDCNVPSSYPEGEYTFIVDENAYAWTNIPGPCGDSAFEDQHNTLVEWKAEYPDANILRFEIEVDNWIEASNSEVSNILVNDGSVSETPILLSNGEINFNVETEFALDLVPNTYTITTTVDLA